MFKWNGNHKDKEQVRPFLARYAELRESGLSYNDDFRSKIPGVAGSPDEDKAIYMLSCLWDIEQQRAQIAEALDNGFHPIERGKPGDKQRFAEIIVYREGYYVGGTGLLSKIHEGRLCFNPDGVPFMVLPKGRRVSGYNTINAQVLVR